VTAGRLSDPPGQEAWDPSLAFVGSFAFGVGWARWAYAPVPAIADVGVFDSRAALFVLAMAAGMALHAALAGAEAPSATLVHGDG